MMTIGLVGFILVAILAFLVSAWFHATKAMMTIGLVGFILVAILAFVYMFVHVINKNVVITAFAVLCFVSG